MPELDAALTTIVFSRDRACQLDLLLRSMDRYVGADGIETTVLYTTSGAEFDDGYRQLRSELPRVRFVDERAQPGGFRESLMSLVRAAGPFLMFLVDDGVFTSRFTMQDHEFVRFADDRRLLCLSLRMAPHITYCYSLDRETPPPPFPREWEWRWRGAPGDWGYPMSLDGHVFRTAELRPRLEEPGYSNPNTLEALLAGRPLEAEWMSCYPTSRLVNLPVNRVQTVFPNRSGGGDPADLNDIFLRERRRIRLDLLDSVINIAPHHEVELEFEDRPEAEPAR